MTGAGMAGAAGTTHVASSDRAKAITAGAGTGGGAVSPGRSARNCDDAGEAPVAASGLRLASTVALGTGTIAGAVRTGVGAVGADGVDAGPPGTCWSIGGCGNGSSTGATAGLAPATCAGTSTRRRSGTSIRRSRQGNQKPGRPVPSPPKTKPNSSAWISSESSNAGVSRLCSGLMRWPPARRWNPSNSSVLRRLCSGTAAGGRQAGTWSGGPVGLTGAPVTTLRKPLGDIREPGPVHGQINSRQTWGSILTCRNEP